MAAAGSAHVAGEHSVLNLAVWYGNPASVDEHLYADWRYSERCGRTVNFVAARRAFAIHQMRVDVVGGGRLRADTQGARHFGPPSDRKPESIGVERNRTLEIRDVDIDQYAHVTPISMWHVPPPK